MKKKILIVLFISSGFFLLLPACNNSSNNTSNPSREVKEAKSNTGKEYTSAYICPMHCKGSGSDSAGVCPVCAMEYIANEDKHNHDGHSH